MPIEDYEYMTPDQIRQEELDYEFNASFDYHSELWASERRALELEDRNEMAYQNDVAEAFAFVETMAWIKLARRGIQIPKPAPAISYRGAKFDTYDDIPF